MLVVLFVVPLVAGASWLNNPDYNHELRAGVELGFIGVLERGA